MSGTQYGTVRYWDDRYGKDTSLFEWYEAYQPLKPLILVHLPRDEPILQIGVGTSEIQLDMLHDGYKDIVSQDISSAAIQQMQQLHKDHTGLTYVVGDCRAMPELEDDSFGGVLDKGTVDSLLCADGGASQADGTLQECYRILKPGGRYLMITYASPMYRLERLSQLNWDIEIYMLDRRVSESDGDPRNQKLVPPPPPTGRPPGGSAQCSDASEAARRVSAELASTSSGRLDARQTIGRKRPSVASVQPLKIDHEKAMELGGNEGHFIYVCTKRSSQDSDGASSTPQRQSSTPRWGSIPHDGSYDKQKLLMSDGQGQHAEQHVMQTHEKRQKT